MGPQTYCFTLDSAVDAAYLATTRGFIARNLDRFQVNSHDPSRRFFKFDA